MDDDMKRTTNRLNHYLGRPSSRQDMKAMSAPNHGKSSLVGADGQLVTAIHQQESTHNQLWIARHITYNLGKTSSLVALRPGNCGAPLDYGKHGKGENHNLDDLFTFLSSA